MGGVNRPQDEAAVWFETPIRVRYAETDKMGVVYHGNFFTWFEVGRTDLCLQCGFSYRDMEADEDAHLMVVEATCRYRRPARYEDDLVVRTRVAEFAKRTLSFEYEVVRAASGEVLATGATSHVVTTSNGRVRSFPERQARLVRARLLGSHGAVRLDVPQNRTNEEPDHRA